MRQSGLAWAAAMVVAAGACAPDRAPRLGANTASSARSADTGDTGALDCPDYDGDGEIRCGFGGCVLPSGFCDCHDDDAEVHPAAAEICDGRDNDCDGLVDDEDDDVTGPFQSLHADEDLDGYGDPDILVEACAVGEGAVDNDLDCDDTEALAWTGATEVYDHVDNDCDGQVDMPVYLSHFGVDTDTVWSHPPEHHIVVTEQVIVAVGATLHIAPGTNVEFAPGASILVRGMLVTLGEPDALVQLGPTHEHVGWGGVTYADEASTATWDEDGTCLDGNRMHHTWVLYGGNVHAAIYASNRALCFNHSRIGKGRTGGLELHDTDLSFVGGDIHDHTAFGVSATFAAGTGHTVEMVGVEMRNNLTYGVVIDGGSEYSNTVSLRDLYLHENALAGISLRGVTLTELSGSSVRQGDLGILLEDVLGPLGGEPVIEANAVTGNTHAGLRVLGSGAVVRNSVFAYNAIAIEIVDWGPSYVVEHNLFYRGSESVVSRVAVDDFAFRSNTVQQPDGVGADVIHLPRSEQPSVIDDNQFLEVEAPRSLIHNAMPVWSDDVLARDNFWDTTDPAEIEDRILHGADDPSLGLVVVQDALAAHRADVPISVPTGLGSARTGPDEVTLHWDPNPEPDVAGYRVWYINNELVRHSEDPIFPYDGTGVLEGDSGIDVGDVTTFVLTGAVTAPAVRVTVTAYDADADGVDDLFEGHASWYAPDVTAF